MTFKPSKIIVIILSFFALALFIIYYLIFSDIKTKNQHASILEQELSSQTKNQQYMLSLKRNIQNADSDISSINNSIMSEDGDVAFIEDLENFANDNNLTLSIDSLTLEDSQILASSSITSLKVRAKTKGSWFGTYKFLARMESLPLKIKIYRFGFTKTVNEIGVDNKKISNQVPVWQGIFEMNVLKYK